VTTNPADTFRAELANALHDDWCGCDSWDGTNCETYCEGEFPGSADAALAVVQPLLGRQAAEVARLTRERDEAQAELASFYSATRGLAGMFWADPEDHQALETLGDIGRQLAAWRADATQVPEGWQSLVRKGWSVGARSAILADAEAYQDLLGAIWLHVGWRSVTRQLTTEQRELWAAAVETFSDPDVKVAADRWWCEAALVSGSDTTKDGGGRG
jgi:hypothetical protein